MKRGHQEVGGDGGGRRGRCGNGGTYLMDDTAAASASVSKGKSLKKEEKVMMLVQDAGDDEQLAALGYKVRSSSMADVAQKLEQLEMAMAVGNGSGFEGFRNGFIAGSGLGTDTNNSVSTHLVTETVHYNPSDLNSWLENMLSELNVPLLPQPSSSSTAAECSTMQTIDFSSSTSDFDDLTAIIPVASREKKRIKPSTPPTSSLTPTSPPAPTCLPPSQPPVSHLPMVLVEDSQEAGIRLVHALLACADAIQQEKLLLAETLVKQITVLTTSQGGAMRKVATYFAEALARRIYQIQPMPLPSPPESLSSDLLEMHFYEACPYLKFAHFTANQAILEAFAGKSHVHVIDFGIKQGLQWPALMQALALRPGGPPVFRLTGIGPPQPNSHNVLEEVGWNLAEFADTLQIKYDYRSFIVNSLADLDPFMLDTGDNATTAINCILEFHSLLASPGSIDKVLETTKALKPAILTLVEQEANHNGPIFIDRFTEALHYYSSMFDSLEGGGTTTTAADSAMGMNGHDSLMSEMYVGKQIFDVVACEGRERKERHETAEQWKARMCSAGFEMLPLGSNAYKQASMLLEHFASGDGYRVEEMGGCLMLGWHTRPLFTTSAWRLPSSSSAAARDRAGPG